MPKGQSGVGYRKRWCDTKNMGESGLEECCESLKNKRACHVVTRWHVKLISVDSYTSNVTGTSKDH